MLRDDGSFALQRVPLAALALAMASVLFLGAAGGLLALNLFQRPSAPPRVVQAIVIRPQQRFVAHPSQPHRCCCPPPPCCPAQHVVNQIMTPPPPTTMTPTQPPMHAWPLLFAGILAAAALGTSFVVRRRSVPMHP